MISKTIAIVGASREPKKYSHKAIKAFLQSGYKVYPINPQAEEIAGLKTYPDIESLPEKVNEVSVYVPPAVTIGILHSLVGYKLEKIYLNPGSADDIVRDLAQNLDLPVIEACSIRSQGYNPDML